MNKLILILSNSLMMPNYEGAITLFTSENTKTVIVLWQPSITETWLLHCYQMIRLTLILILEKLVALSII